MRRKGNITEYNFAIKKKKKTFSIKQQHINKKHKQNIKTN